MSSDYVHEINLRKLRLSNPFTDFFLTNLKTIFSLIFLPFIILLSIRHVLRSDQRETYRYCHRVYSSGIAISDFGETLDWFISENNILGKDM